MFEGEFRLGVLESVGLTWLPRLIDEMRKRYPRLTPHPEINTSANLLDRLERRQIDLAVLTDTGTLPSENRSIELAQLQIGVFGAPAKVKNMGSLCIEELQEIPIIAHSQLSGTQKTLNSFMRRRGIYLEPHISSNSLSVTVHLAASGMGFVFLPRGVLMAFSASLIGLFLSNAMLGIGQTLVLAGLHISTSRCSTRMHRDMILGNYMVAISLGQAAGPLIVGIGQAQPGFLVLPCLLSLLLTWASVVLVRRLPKTTASGHGPPNLRNVARTPGLWWLVMIGAICVASQDLLLAFLPVYGEEVGLSPAFVGILLSIRALGAIVSRALYGHMVARIGRIRVTFLSALIGGLSLTVLAFPNFPPALIATFMAAVGFGLGLALTGSVALTLLIVPYQVRGTVLSMRLTVIRVAQFVIPICAGIAVGSFGAGATFALSGAALVGTAGLRPKGMSLKNVGRKSRCISS
ncbi:MFS transporter [Paracoccus albus]|uniref:MFS transporter n=1 Tax=Paracoccus albus TaxID=3017784 RepID=UPI0022F11A7D|nr:MFS transporter [Paracoccus albus]WBU61594.1 MFS transporter [Paracoccus albus]